LFYTGLWGAIFTYTAVEFSEDCIYRLFGERSSGILQWAVLKAVLYSLAGGAVFRYSAVDCIEHCIIQV